MTLSFEERQALRRLISEARMRQEDRLPVTHCLWPPCGKELEETRPWNRMKRKFCCDKHRQRYWVQYTEAGRAWVARTVAQNRDKRRLAA